MSTKSTPTCSVAVDLLHSCLRRWAFWIVLALLLVGFFVLTIIVRDTGANTSLWLHQVDHNLLEKVQSWRSPSLTPWAIKMTHLGSDPFLATLAILVGALLWLRKKSRLVVYLMVVGLGAWLLSRIMKYAVARERPASTGWLVEVHSYSYPSGHSMGATCIYLAVGILFCHVFQKPWQRAAVGLVVSLLIVLVGLSRIYLGVHYPSDVAGGILIGTIWALVANRIFKRVS